MTYIKRTSSIAAVLCTACLTCVLAGCNTFEGVGEDVSALGQGLERTAQDTNFYDDK